MNKSDIIKAAEKCKNLLEGRNNPIPEHLFTAEKALIAAAELLKQVEVVEAGEMPRVGDIVNDSEYAKEEGVTMSCFSWDKFYRFEEGMEIIQRAGKPVITRGSV